MRRTIFLALFAALVIAPAAHAADPTEIIRDCADDDVLQGTYSVSELRDARDNLPTDIDEYSACRDVLARAISAKTASSKPSPTATPNDTTSGGSTPDTGTGTTTTPEPDPSPYTPEEQAALSAPSSPADAEAVNAAAAQGDTVVRASAKSPGAARLAADVGRNGLPTTMLVVLVLLAATLVAACLPLLRRGRRGNADPSP